MRDTSNVEREIAALCDLSLEALRLLWAQLYGQSPSKSLRRKFLVRAISYQLQVKAFGGLPESTKQRLRTIAVAAAAGTFDPASIGPRIKPGTKLVRTWHGKTYTVIALDDGFSWNGEQHSSLSSIAKAITGTSWNGWKFFGLKGASSEHGRDVLGRFKQPVAGPNGSPAWPRSQAANGAEPGAVAHA